MSEKKYHIKALCIGLDALCKETVGKLFESQAIQECPYDLEYLSEASLDPAPTGVFCGQVPAEISLIEVAQLLRMQYQNTPIYYVTSLRKEFDRKIFQKNGFTDAFLIPFDTVALTELLKADLTKASHGEIKSYKPVKLVDIPAGTVLDFDTFLYMPVNKKHIKYSAAGDPIEAERLKKLTQHQVSSIQISNDQKEKFYEFTAKRLREIGSSGAMSETERREKMQSSVRNLVGDLFNDSSKDANTTKGKEVVADCKEIVKSFITTMPDQKNAWFERIMNSTGFQSDSYSHAANVATFSALFSMGLGIGNPEDMALAGLLHDIGLVDVPLEIQLKLESQWTPEEKAQYVQHIDHSIKIIRDRKLVVSDIVLRMIVEHHERFNGTGYPKGVAAKRIALESQVLALADTFDYMTAEKEGQPRMTPAEALTALWNETKNNPASASFNPELVEKLYKLFMENTPKAASA